MKFVAEGIRGEELINFLEWVQAGAVGDEFEVSIEGADTLEKELVISPLNGRAANFLLVASMPIAEGDFEMTLGNHIYEQCRVVEYDFDWSSPLYTISYESVVPVVEMGPVAEGDVYVEDMG